MKSSRYFYIILLVIGCTLNCGSALGEVSQEQKKPGARTVTELIQLLPQPQSDGKSPLTIQGSRATEFKQIIIPELYPIVREGLYEMSVLQDLSYPWQYDEAWTQASQHRSSLALGSDPMRLSREQLESGFPFGTMSEILVTPDSVDEKKKIEWGSKIIWNVQSLWWSQRAFSSNLEISIVRSQKVERTYTADFLRLYPLVALKSTTNDQVFRELLRFSNPSALTNLSFLTFRSLGSEEDAVWLFSPTLKKVRQLTGVVRSDSVLKTELSLDDLLVWSEKPELVEARFDKEIRALVPFVSKQGLSELMQSGSNCVQVKESVVLKDDAETDVGICTSTRIPSIFGTVYVPRILERIELGPRSPFSSHGREVLYVDKETLLPVVKIVYDRVGSLSRIVTGVFGLAELSEKKRRLVYPNYIVSFVPESASSTVVQFHNWKSCQSLEGDFELSNFDPSHLDPEQAETKTLSKSSVSSAKSIPIQSASSVSSVVSSASELPDD